MNLTKLCLLALMLASITSESNGQLTRYLVKFRNKADNAYSISDPSPYLSARSISRRTRYGIAIDSTDLPVTSRYLDSIRSVPGVTLLNVSKWLNQVSIHVTDQNAISRINAMPFVAATSQIAARLGDIQDRPQKNKFDKESLTDPFMARTADMMADYYTYGSSATQIKMHKADFLHNIGLHGENIIIGVLDAGFTNHGIVSSLDSARREGRILGTWDFVARETAVDDHSHGLQVVSVIAANLPGQFVGSAPEASFYLFRTEDGSSEFPIEEHNWVCGAERVDSAGGDLISSSLGYNIFDAPIGAYSFSVMNGNTTMAAIGADLAAKKGILVSTAAGNEGNGSWGRIVTPADADSAMTVGAVSTSGAAASFTSRGPSADGQVKPDVASLGVGTTVQNPSGSISGANGTSFATPNISGIAACLWQGFQEFNNMKIIDALRKAGSRATNPNDSVGYGIPNAKLALMNLTKDFSTATATLNACAADISWTSKDVAGMRYEIERKSQGESSFTKVGEVYGTGSIFSTHSYNFTDSIRNAQAGTLLYRIRQVIDTSVAGFFADYTDTITLSLASACFTSSINLPPSVEDDITLMPNPANNEVRLKFRTTNSIHEMEINIIDGQGRIVHTMNTNKPAGTSVITIPLQQLAKGKYYISITSKGKRIGLKELVKL